MIPAEQFAFELHRETMYACRAYKVGWDRADKIAQETVRRTCFASLSGPGWDEYWEGLLIRALADALNEIDAEKTER